MEKDKHIMVITDDENSDVVKMLLRIKVIPITRRSIITALELLRRLQIVAIIIDKEHQNVDSLEFILNTRDVASKIPIFIPEQYHLNEDWSKISNLGKIEIYNESNYSIKQQIKSLLGKNN